MADTKIEDLPLLDSSELNPLADYVIIQKPGGGTYKMLAGSLGSGSGSMSSYVDGVTMGGVYDGSFNNGGTHTKNYGTLRFQSEGLLNSSSTWVLNIHLENMTKGSQVQTNHSSGTNGIAVFDSKAVRFVKSANLDLVNNIYDTDSSQSFSFFDHRYTQAFYSSGRQQYKASAKLTCTLTMSRNDDSIEFSDITLTHYDINLGRNTSYGWPLNVDILADINASIGA